MLWTVSGIFLPLILISEPCPSNSDQFPFLKRWNPTIGSRAMLLLLLEKARGLRVLKFFKWPAPACFSQNLFEKWLRNKTIGVDTIEINLIQPSSGLSKLFRKDQPKIHHLSLYLDFLMAHSEFYHSIWYSCQILSSTALPSFEFLKTTPMRMMPSKYKTYVELLQPSSIWRGLEKVWASYMKHLLGGWRHIM